MIFYKIVLSEHQIIFSSLYAIFVLISLDGFMQYGYLGKESLSRLIHNHTEDLKASSYPKNWNDTSHFFISFGCLNHGFESIQCKCKYESYMI